MYGTKDATISFFQIRFRKFWVSANSDQSDFIDMNFLKFKHSAVIEDRIYIRFAMTFMWLSINWNVLTNQIDKQSAKTHEMTRYYKLG